MSADKQEATAGETRFYQGARGIVSRFVCAAIEPIAKIAMRFGMSARDFADATRWVFVKVFHSTPEFWQHGHPTVVQCAIKTGLSRSHVKAMQAIPEPQQVLFTQRQNLAYRVVEGWVSDPLFHDEIGRPAPLPLQNRNAPSFTKLFLKYGNDVPMASVLGDLQQVGCVTVKNDVVTLVNQTYGMNFLDEDKLAIAGYMLRRLGETTDHNLTHPDLDDRRLQRFWFQTRVPAEHAAAIKKVLHEKCVEAGRSIDQLLAEYSTPLREPGVEYVDLGVSMYLYEDLDLEEEDAIKHGLAERSDIR